jgi:hypothetical protein
MKLVFDKLIKIAYDLDSRGKYTEAEKIDALIKSLQERVGLHIIEDIISLADDLDQSGESKTAEQLDEMIAKFASCPQCGNHEFSKQSDIVCEDCGYPYVKDKRDPGLVHTKKMPQKCPICNKRYPSDIKHCPNCGISPDENISEFDIEGKLNILGKLVSLASKLDLLGYTKEADIIDNIIIKIAKTKYKTWKGKDEKPPEGAAHKAPKGWFDKMKDELRKKNPDYSMKRINEIIGDIWDNQLTDAKRRSIYKTYGKKGDPNE